MSVRLRDRLRTRGTAGGSGAVTSYLPGGSLLDGLVAYYTLDEASGTRYNLLDSSLYPLTDVNTVGSAAGKKGNAASFVALNSEQLTYSSGLNWKGSQDRTISFWLNRGTDPGTGENFLYLPISLAIYHGIGESTVIRAIAYDSVSGNSIASWTGARGTWVHVLAEYAGATKKMTLYVNGDFVEAGTALDHGLAAENSLRIGGDGGGGGSWSQGLIDEVGLWNRPTTPSERAILWNNGNGRVPPFWI